jgi:hypothetical protein
MSSMDLCVRQFLAAAEQDGQEAVTVAYELFKLIKQVARGMLLSAVREARRDMPRKASRPYPESAA